MFTTKIFLRKDQVNKDGKNSVTLRLINNRQKKYYSLRIYVYQKDWNYNHLRVKKSDKDFLRKNKLITKFENKANNIVDSFFLDDKQLSFNEFSNKLWNKEYDDSSFVEYVSDKLPKRKLAKETFKAYKSQLSKMQQFKSKIYFSDITISFVHEYKQFLLDKLGNNENTTYKSLRILKLFINRAVEDKLMKENPFKNFKTKHINGKREHLTILELEKLENLYEREELNNNLQNVLRYFLFACHTGLRYIDLKNVTFNNIKRSSVNRNEFDVVDITMHKTKLPVVIPLTNKAKLLIPKKYANNQKVFDMITNQKTNDNLKKIIDTVGINKKITFHCARHTLATTGLEMGIPIEVISKILGHTELKTTQIYAKVNAGLKYREMMKLDQKAV